MTAYPFSFFASKPSTASEEPPVGGLELQNDTATVDEGGAITISPLANDRATDSATLSINRIVRQPSSGTLAIINNNTQLRYTSTAPGTYVVTIEVRSSSGATGQSDVTITVRDIGTTPPPIAGFAKPWGGGQIGTVIGAGGAWETHYGHAPTAVAGWTSYNNMTTPQIFAGGTMGSTANWGENNGVFNGTWNYHVSRSLQIYGGRVITIWVFPGVPMNWTYKNNANIWGTFISGGINHTDWKDMWFAVGRRTAAMINRLNGAYDKFIMDVAWEMTNLTYAWSVGSAAQVTNWRDARRIAIDEFRRGARAHAAAGDKIQWMMRVAANTNGSTLAGLWTGNGHETIIGRSWHENLPDAALGVGRPWHIRSGWAAEQNGTWNGYQLDEVANFCIANNCKIGQSEVGHAKERVGPWENRSRSPVTGIDKIFAWCKKYEQHFSHWCWLHSNNRPMLGTGWAETVAGTGGGTWEVSNRIKALFNGTHSPIYKDIYTGGN